MPRIYDAPCAGCGRILPGTPRSLPAGERCCQPCRRVLREQRPQPVSRELPCTVCGTVFVSAHPKAKYCGRKCKRSHKPGCSPSRTLEAIRKRTVRARATARTCIVCTAGFTSTGKRQRCSPCQDADLVAVRPCMTCGRQFAARRSQDFCSVGCQWRTYKCVDCAVSFDGPLSGVKRCPDCSLAHLRARYRQKNAVRRGAAAAGRPVSIGELGDRDSWRCHLCRLRVNRDLRYPHPKSPSFDHLIPISDGGVDAPENLALAHLVCNTRRRAGGSVQLLLIG